MTLTLNKIKTLKIIIYCFSPKPGKKLALISFNCGISVWGICKLGDATFFGKFSKLSKYITSVSLYVIKTFYKALTCCHTTRITIISKLYVRGLFLTSVYRRSKLNLKLSFKTQYFKPKNKRLTKPV